ncbi:MAG: hypothetical protein ACK5NB_11205 [Flavobacteriaceae bacterium]
MKLGFNLLFVLVLWGCSSNNVDERCRYLIDRDFSLSIDLSLPEYSVLKSGGNSVYIPNYGGNHGIIIASTGLSFHAWDAADPNDVYSDCSVLKNKGLEATSNCENGNTYSLVTGQALGDDTLHCTLKYYAVTQSGNTLIISN